jgi:hypothetical protein
VASRIRNRASPAPARVHRPPADEPVKPADPLAPARGILVGFGLGLVLWAGMLVAVVHIIARWR